MWVRIPPSAPVKRNACEPVSYTHLDVYKRQGGMVFAIYRELGLPVRFIGTGERLQDLAPFDADQFIAGLFD